MKQGVSSPVRCVRLSARRCYGVLLVRRNKQKADVDVDVGVVF